MTVQEHGEDTQPLFLRQLQGICRALAAPSRGALSVHSQT
jgi:hypothetical protein